MPAGSKMRQLFGVNVGEVSFVDAPAVPKAKLVLLKQLVSSDSKDASLLPLVKAAEMRIAAVRGALKDSGAWDEMDDAAKGDFAKMEADIQTTSTAMHALDGVEKFYDEYDNVDSDAVLLSDVNWASNMLISVKGTFDRLGERVGEDAQELMGSLKTQTLASIKDAAGLMVAVVEGIMANADDAGEGTTKKDETVADDTPPTEEVTDTTTDETPVAATMQDILDAVTGISAKVDDAVARLTILEATGEEVPASADADETVADATPETVVADVSDDDVTVGLPTEAEIEAAVLLYPDMEPDERKAVEEMLTAVAEHMGITPEEVATGAVADDEGDGSDEAAAA